MLSIVSFGQRLGMGGGTVSVSECLSPRSSKMFVCPQPANSVPKCPPKKARNRDKAELATKVRNQVQTVLM